MQCFYYFCQAYQCVTPRLISVQFLHVSKCHFTGRKWSLCVRTSHCCWQCQRKFFFGFFPPCLCDMWFLSLLLVSLDPSALGHWKSSVEAVCRCFLSGALIVECPERQKKSPGAIYHCQLSCRFLMMAAFRWWGFLRADAGWWSQTPCVWHVCMYVWYIIIRASTYSDQ